MNRNYLKDGVNGKVGIGTASPQEVLEVQAGNVKISAGYSYLIGNVRICTGSGSPNGLISAPPGSIYLNTSGGSGTTLYVKESGSGSTGWVGK